MSIFRDFFVKEKPVFTGITRGIGGFGFGSGATSSYWFTTLSAETNYNVIGNGVIADSIGNIYAVGYYSDADGQKILTIKYNKSGEIVWQRSLHGSQGDYGESIALDSVGGVYICGRTRSVGPGGLSGFIAKYNTVGALQWQRSIGSSNNDNLYGIAVDSSNNVYAVGDTNTSGNNDLLLVKYNSSGTIQWQRVLGGSGTDYGYSIAFDSSDNLYVCGQRYNSSYIAFDFLIAKYNSSGTIQWQKHLGDQFTSVSDIGRGAAVDSSGNVYVVGYSTKPAVGSDDVILAKYDSSGTIQWQRYLGGTENDKGHAIAIDSSDNIYIFGETRSAGGSDADCLLAKYNSSGTIQWQRTFGGSSNEEPHANSLAIDADDNICFVSETRSVSDIQLLLVKVPNDGSLTGTYGSFTYASSSLTSGTSTLGDNTGSLTDSSVSLTDASASMTASTPTLTTSTTTL